MAGSSKPRKSVHSAACFLSLLLCLAWLNSTRAEELELAGLEAVHLDQVMQWRANRDSGLRREHGWLSLVGLEWLQEGTNSLGNATTNSVQIPGGPDHWGDIALTDDRLIFIPNQGSGVLVNGEEVEQAILLADDNESPTEISHGTIQLHVIFRESYGVRISDTQAPARLAFQGVDNFDVQYDWLVNGKFMPAPDGASIEIGNVLGQLLQMPVYGWLEFELNGKAHRLAGVGDDTSETLWFLFADRTSGRETYGAGRFLYSEGMPKDGRLLVDFNKAYNPPCAFNDYSTCPLPPLENRLDLAVTAGEKNFHPAETQ